MEQFLLFLTAAVTALAVENAVLVRGLGLAKDTMFMKSPREGILFGAVFTWLATMSSMLVALVNGLLAGNPYVMIVRAPLFLVCVLFVYIATWEIPKRFWPKLYAPIRPFLPLCAFNTALFGAFYIAAMRSYSFGQTVGYAFGLGVGVTAAILIIYYVRKRLSISPVPRAFRGLPILLVYLGLLSLAVYGLIGHGLAV